MTPLQAAAQAVLDRWDSPAWEWSKQGPTAELMAALRAALAQEQPTGCERCNSPLFVGARCSACGRVTEQAEPVQEPVAWEGWWLHHGQHNYRAKPLTSVRVKELMMLAFEVGREAAPPQRKPLTDEEIEQEYKKGYADGYAAGYDNGDSEGFTRGTDSMVPASLAAWRAETKPLTEAQIYAAIKGIDSLKAVEVARAVERAHGIKENAND